MSLTKRANYVLFHVARAGGARPLAESRADARRRPRSAAGGGCAHRAPLRTDLARARHPCGGEAGTSWRLLLASGLLANTRADERGGAGVDLWPAGGGATSAGTGCTRRRPHTQESDARLALGDSRPHRRARWGGDVCDATTPRWHWRSARVSGC